MARTKHRPSKPRKIPKKLADIPPHVSIATNYHEAFHSCPSQQLQNGLRWIDHRKYKPRSIAGASAKRTGRRMTGKGPTTRGPSKQDSLHTSEGAPPATSHQGSYSSSAYITPQSSYNSAAPPIVYRGFEDVYRLEVPASTYIPPDSLWPSSSVEFLTLPLTVPTSQVVDFDLQAHSLGDGSYMVQEQSANQVFSAASPLTHRLEWDVFSSGSMPVGAYGYPQELALESDLAMMVYAMPDFFG